MRRIVSAVVLAALSAALSAVVPATASGPGSGSQLVDPTIVGTLVDSSTGAPVGGTTLQLRQDVGGAPGAVVDSDVTAADGSFGLAPPSAVDYWVEVVRNAKVQGGYVLDHSGTHPSTVEYDASAAAPIHSGTDLGDVLDAPSFISGVVVNAANGNRLRGINVSTRAVTALGTVLNADTTNTDGFFRIPIWGEDFGLRVNGTARGFEKGWWACNRTVVPTWGAACQVSIGRIGKVRLDHV